MLVGKVPWVDRYWLDSQYEGDALWDAQPVKADKRCSNMLWPSDSEDEPCSNVSNRLELVIYYLVSATAGVRGICFWLPVQPSRLTIFATASCLLPQTSLSPGTHVTTHHPSPIFSRGFAMRHRARFAVGHEARFALGQGARFAVARWARFAEGQSATFSVGHGARLAVVQGPFYWFMTDRRTDVRTDCAAIVAEKR